MSSLEPETSATQKAEASLGKPEIRPARSESEKIEALVHVSYEAWMTAEMLHVLRTLTGAARPVEWNAAMECGLLHARALTEFFLPKNTPGVRDITPQDFAAPWTVEPAQSAQILRMNRKKIHGHVAHLSWDRVDMPERTDVAVILECAVRITLGWCEHLRRSAPELAASPHFAAQIANAEKAFTRVDPNRASVSVTTTTGP